MGDYPKLTRWAQCNHKVIVRGTQESQSQRENERNVMMESGVRERETFRGRKRGKDLKMPSCRVRRWRRGPAS